MEYKKIIRILIFFALNAYLVFEIYRGFKTGVMHLGMLTADKKRGKALFWMYFIFLLFLLALLFPLFIASILT